MKLYDASRAHLTRHGLKAKDARRLFNTLAALIDYEGHIKEAMDGGDTGMSQVCDALRLLVDGYGCKEECCAETA